MEQFKPFQKVLTKEEKNDYWFVDFFGEYGNNSCPFATIRYPFGCMYCIPYEGNEHLLGTTDSPKQKHEYKWGEIVECETENDVWKKAIYITYDTGLKLHHVVYEGYSCVGHATHIRPLKEK